jgi:hypothetical protein
MWRKSCRKNDACCSEFRIATEMKPVKKHPLFEEKLLRGGERKKIFPEFTRKNAMVVFYKSMWQESRME